ncbi:MAG: HDOD domain-containing protein [Marinobacter sp.]|uniref:HDOD domain-containing protein n=1 Tax=Marinobacter sp. TaxID=50741 RepID=UPI00299F45BA|nr:HDOD domain-containing protein [Marinobacter sp.]MDX1634063.1 HDOD domain-containing protein [Marinobacter sp.]
MPLSARLEQYLNRKGIVFDEVALSPAPGFDAAILHSGLAREDVIQATMLIDLKGVVMAVHPFDTVLDPDAIRQLTGRSLQPLTPRQADRLFGDCEPGFHPPIGGAYELPVLVDSSVMTMATAYMAAGSDRTLLRLEARSLRLTMAGARQGRLVMNGSGQGALAGQRSLTLEEVAEQLQKLYRLPPMPALALRIMRLTANPDASARELAELIEFDPSLTAQVMRYARSALFNYPGQIDSVQDAVTRVLGFDRVAHIALGIASVRAFDVPRQGMLGMDEFWRHSLYCAFLCQRMAAQCKADKGLAYLCGLLHNFGLLLIGHLFPTEFDQLNRLREDNPEHSMRALERQVFGAGNGQDLLAVGHGAIGGILHKLWQLPEAVIKSAGVHQNGDYHGDHETYVLMVQLANELLKEKGVGDEFNVPEPDLPAQRLGLASEDLDELRESIDTVAPDLDALARSLTG